MPPLISALWFTFSKGNPIIDSTAPLFGLYAPKINLLTPECIGALKICCSSSKPLPPKYYNIWTLRYYLKRYGVDKTAFQGRHTSSADIFLLITIQCDDHSAGLDPLPENWNWDINWGPYALATYVLRQ